MRFDDVERGRIYWVEIPKDVYYEPRIRTDTVVGIHDDGAIYLENHGWPKTLDEMGIRLEFCFMSINDALDEYRRQIQEHIEQLEAQASVSQRMAASKKDWLAMPKTKQIAYIEKRLGNM